MHRGWLGALGVIVLLVVGMAAMWWRDAGSAVPMPAHQFSARVASGAAAGVSGLVEVRLDSRSNAPIGSFAVGNTGGWQSWRTVPANISAVTGVHTVYLTFTSGQPADFVNLNWFTFVH